MNILKKLILTSSLIIFFIFESKSVDIGLNGSFALTHQNVRPQGFESTMFLGANYTLGLCFNIPLADQLDLQIAALGNFLNISDYNDPDGYSFFYEASGSQAAFSAGLRIPAYAIYKFNDVFGVSAGAIIDVNLFRRGYDVTIYDSSVSDYVTQATYAERLILPAARIGIVIENMHMGQMYEFFFARDIINRSSDSSVKTASNYLGVCMSYFF